MISGTVTTSAVGVYSVNYNVSDTAGNDAVQVTRTVNVEAPTVKNAHEIQIDANTNIALDSTVGGVGVFGLGTLIVLPVILVIVFQCFWKVFVMRIRIE